MADKKRTEESVDSPILKVLIRGGGGKEHDLLKAVGYLWLIEEGYDIVDCEAGGYDVLGVILAKPSRYLRDPLKGLHRRCVIDAKTSMGDLVHHFRKDIVSNCDIDGKFSTCSNEHYILARRGTVKVDAVHDPWGLLEYVDGGVKEVKKAQYRAYIGDNEDLMGVSVRMSKLIASFMNDPKSLRDVKEQLPDETRRLLYDKDTAREHIRNLQSQLVRLCSTFEVLHGYHPLKEKLDIL